MTLKDELARSVGAQYATGEEQRTSSRRNEEAESKRTSSRRNEEAESKRKQYPVVDVSGDESKV